MKRDTELIREILLKVEECSEPAGLMFFAKKHAEILMIPAKDLDWLEDLTDEVEYNIDLACEAGLLRKKNVAQYLALNLTNVGHDVVEKISDASFWSKLKDVTPSQAKDVVSGTMGATAAAALGKLLGL